MRTCNKCEGKGYRVRGNRREKCYACYGLGYFPEPDYKQILEDITVARKGRRTLRKSPPALDRDTLRGARAYYVWRLARFHGGADVTMPVVAEIVAGDDAYAKELDAFAGKVAERVFGTQMAAAFRWGAILWGVEPPAGLPATAYRFGPAVLDDKPLEELAELM